MLVDAKGNHLGLRDQLKALKDQIKVRVTTPPKPRKPQTKPVSKPLAKPTQKPVAVRLRPVEPKPEPIAVKTGRTFRLPKTGG
jgi:hypothetical protein